MKKINLTGFIIFTLLINFIFFPLEKSNGQTSSSSSGQCIFCTQVVPNCSSNEIIVPQTCNECAHCVSTSSTSSGCPQIQTNCVGEPLGCESEFGIYDPKICMCVCPGLSSSSGNPLALNKNFNGVWKEKICNKCGHCEKCKSSKPITLKLCIKGQRLEGTVNIYGDVENGTIISQNIISNNEVSITIKGKNDLTEELTLTLNAKKHLQVSIDGGQTFGVRKLNSFTSCSSSISSSSGGNDCSPKGNCRGTNGEKLSCPLGTECSGLPAYGCYPSGCPVPICCSPDTKIRTDSEQKRIADIKKGEIVLTDDGKAVRVKKVSKTPVKNHKVLKVLLNDGTVLEISPGHPTADGRKFKDLKMRDILDGRLVVEVKLIPYIYSHTYDILPDSKSGNYYANGVLIGSTLK